MADNSRAVLEGKLIEFWYSRSGFFFASHGAFPSWALFRLLLFQLILPGFVLLRKLTEPLDNNPTLLIVFILKNQDLYGF